MLGVRKRILRQPQRNQRQRVAQARHLARVGQLVALEIEHGELRQVEQADDTRQVGDSIPGEVEVRERGERAHVDLLESGVRERQVRQGSVQRRVGAAQRAQCWPPQRFNFRF